MICLKGNALGIANGNDVDNDGNAGAVSELVIIVAHIPGERNMEPSRDRYRELGKKIGRKMIYFSDFSSKKLILWLFN